MSRRSRSRKRSREFGCPPTGLASWWQLIAGPGPFLIRLLVWSQRNACREPKAGRPTDGALAYCPKVGYGPHVLENGSEIG